MTTLDMSIPQEVRLILRGIEENRILETVRHLPCWTSVNIERDPINARLTLGVTLITDRSHESMVREILKRSFNLIFPVEGGSLEFIDVPALQPLNRGRASRKSRF